MARFGTCSTSFKILINHNFYIYFNTICFYVILIKYLCIYCNFCVIFSLEDILYEAAGFFLSFNGAKFGR